MKKRCPIILSDTERDDLKRLIASGTAPARKLTHARILRKADESPKGDGWVDERIAEAVESSQPTVSRVRKQYCCETLEAALNRRPPKREYRRKLDGEQEARLVAPTLRRRCMKRTVRRRRGASQRSWRSTIPLSTAHG